MEIDSFMMREKRFDNFFTQPIYLYTYQHKVNIFNLALNLSGEGFNLSFITFILYHNNFLVPMLINIISLSSASSLQS